MCHSYVYLHVCNCSTDRSSENCTITWNKITILEIILKQDESTGKLNVN